MLVAGEIQLANLLKLRRVVQVEENEHVMLKTFRLAMYPVMEWRPTIADGTGALQD
jgi:hypothetical protein